MNTELQGHPRWMEDPGERMGTGIFIGEAMRGFQPCTFQIDLHWHEDALKLVAKAKSTLRQFGDWI
jgi:hypothetical protein